MTDALLVTMRWIHIASMATLIGGILYGRLVMAPAIATLAPDARESLGDTVAALFRPLVYIAITGLVVSGTFNLLTTTGHRPIYHMLFGVKMLLALHVFAVSILIVQPKNPRRVRMMTGTMISGLIILAIAAWLRLVF
ncbi:MAG: hypothetical protein LAQ69_36955 [Acidobacteriia bacterium]|nr:hypothetical protein [Terriglobia bacterium]